MQGHLFSFVDLQVQTRGNEVVRTSLDMLGTWEHAGAVTDIAVSGGERGGLFFRCRIKNPFYSSACYFLTHLAPHTHLPL